VIQEIARPTCAGTSKSRTPSSFVRILTNRSPFFKGLEVIVEKSRT